MSYTLHNNRWDLFTVCHLNILMRSVAKMFVFQVWICFRGHKDKILSIKYNPFNSDKLVIVGMKHIKFLTQAGKFFSLFFFCVHSFLLAFYLQRFLFPPLKWVQNSPCVNSSQLSLLNDFVGGGLTVKRGTFGSVAKLVTMCCVTYGKGEDVCFSGADTGHVYVWTSNNLQRIVQAHNDGPCFCVSAVSNFEVTFSILTKKISTSRKRRKSASPAWLYVRVYISHGSLIWSFGFGKYQMWQFGDVCPCNEVLKINCVVFSNMHSFLRRVASYGK